MADERVHRKAHFSEEAAAAAAAARANGSQLPPTVQQQQQQLKKQEQQAAGQPEQPQQSLQDKQAAAQTLTYPDKEKAAMRRDIYSIHGEQVRAVRCGGWHAQTTASA
jgi:hypothetical protein